MSEEIKKNDTDIVIDNTANPNFKFIDVENMDKAVRPGDNFFAFANGAWLKRTEIPGDQTRWGSFNILIEKTRDRLDHIIQDLGGQSSWPEGGNEQFVSDFFKSGMNTDKIEKDGLKPLLHMLDRINHISSQEALIEEIAAEQMMGLGGVFGFYVAPDDKQVNREICQWFQGGLGLSPKGAYFDDDERSKNNRAAYIRYVGDMLIQMGENETEARRDAQSIFDLEKTLATVSLSPVEMRDPQKLYNKFSLAEIAQLAPNLHWDLLLNKMSVGSENEFIVATPEFFKELSKQIKETPLEVWKRYLSFHLVSDMAGYLSKNFEDLRFNFYHRIINGQKEQKPRWQRVVGVIGGLVGDALGQLYVQRYFPPDAKKRVNDLVNNLQKAFGTRIQQLTWMSEETKNKALHKLNAFTKKIAYPDKWKDYDGLEIRPDNYVQNVLNAARVGYLRNIKKLGKPVDRTEWGMTPQTVNAYYNPGFNEIVFPAAILQFPFFDFHADDAVNYGGIGAVIGHEMTHGFDDQGSQYDAEGYLKNWWAPEDAERFKKLTDVVRKQFDQYSVAEGTQVNGSLTLGENLADLGGVTIAYDAFKMTNQGKGESPIDGWTPDQRFFLSWAQVWRAKSTTEAEVMRVKIDPHSPEKFRCNGPLSNFTPFYKAFNIQSNDEMWRAEKDRAVVW